MYVNDIDDLLFSRGDTGKEVYTIKLFLLLYADDAVLFSETVNGLQNALNALESYCKRWKLSLNTDKTKIVVFS